MQYDLLMAAPYTYSSDDLLVAVAGLRNDIPKDEWPVLRADLFTKGQPCLRASPLVKTMGWAVHHDGNSHIALIEVGSPRYDVLLADEQVQKIAGMRNARA